MKIKEAYNIQIWVGLRKHYSNQLFTLDNVRDICQSFVDNQKDCVTITPTEFIYVNGNEPGAIIGFINYPRFSRSKIEIKNRAILLAKILMKELHQHRVTITTPDYSMMLENEEE